jgi:hypothetical protein
MYGLTQLGRHSIREAFRNPVRNLCAGAAPTTSISRNPQAHGSQNGLQASAAVVLNGSWPAAGRTSSPVFTMLPQLLFYHGVLQRIHNLLRFLQIDWTNLRTSQISS